MPLIAGTVTVSPVGVAIGVGLAKDLYDAEIASFDGAFAAAFDAQALLAKQSIAKKCAAQALVFDAYVKSATVLVPGITPGPGATTGTIT